MTKPKNHFKHFLYRTQKQQRSSFEFGDNSFALLIHFNENEKSFGLQARVIPLVGIAPFPLFCPRLCHGNSFLRAKTRYRHSI